LITSPPSEIPFLTYYFVKAILVASNAAQSGGQGGAPRAVSTASVSDGSASADEVQGQAGVDEVVSEVVQESDGAVMERRRVVVAPPEALEAAAMRREASHGLGDGDGGVVVGEAGESVVESVVEPVV